MPTNNAKRNPEQEKLDQLIFNFFNKLSYCKHYLQVSTEAIRNLFQKIDYQKVIDVSKVLQQAQKRQKKL